MLRQTADLYMNLLWGAASACAGVQENILHARLRQKQISGCSGGAGGRRWWLAREGYGWLAFLQAVEVELWHLLHTAAYLKVPWPDVCSRTSPTEPNPPSPFR